MKTSASILQLPAGQFNVATSGSGPHTIVFLHGYTDSWRSFELVLPMLSEHARCVAFDQRGHGATRCDGSDFSIESLAQDVVDLLSALRVRRATLVGHSMGSFVARAVALRSPELVERLVLVASGVRSRNDVVSGLEREVRALGGVIPRSFAEDFQASCMLDRASVTPDFFEQLVDVSTRTSPVTWRAGIAALARYDDVRDLSRIACPTLLLGGEHDSVFSAGEQRDLARAIPGARISLFEDSGHSPHWERPERLARELLSFLGAAAAPQDGATERTMSGA